MQSVHGLRRAHVGCRIANSPLYIASIAAIDCTAPQQQRASDLRRPPAGSLGSPNADGFAARAWWLDE